MLEWLIRKTFKMVFMMLLAAGIYNFLRTPTTLPWTSTFSGWQ